MPSGNEANDALSVVVGGVSYGILLIRKSILVNQRVHLTSKCSLDPKAKFLSTFYM
jgi:hypothetical protein